MTLDGIERFLPDLLLGTILTVQLTLGATLLSVVLGLAAAFAKVSRRRLLAVPTSIYVEVIRGTPAIVQLFLVYYGLGQVGVALPAYLAAILALGLFGGAYFAEIFRAGILAVERGQTEAAVALGLSRTSIFRRVILPQTLVVVLPPASNMIIDLLKATALVVTIGAPDLMYAAYSAASTTFRAMEFYLVAGVMYFALATIIYILFSRLESFAGRNSS